MYLQNICYNLLFRNTAIKLSFHYFNFKNVSTDFIKNYFVALFKM